MWVLLKDEPENEYFLPNTTSSQTQMTFADMDTLAMNASSVFPTISKGRKNCAKRELIQQQQIRLSIVCLNA